MNKLKRFIGLSIVVVFGFLILTNPNEQAYLSKLSFDYGRIHSGARLTPNDLVEMGSGHRANYLIMSRYDYAFGNIAVSYIGLGGGIYFLGSSAGHHPPTPSTTDESRSI